MYYSLYCFIAVSYTHLDVYKRQAYYVRKEVYPGRSVSFKEYLWPLSLNDLLVNRNLEQTFGW